MYDPQAAGCHCDECPLREKRMGGPVPPELHAGTRILIVGEAPGSEECVSGRPFVGPSGQEVMHALRMSGVARQDVSWSNAMLCNPGKDRLKPLLASIQKENRHRVVDNRAPTPTPMACCLPRLQHELWEGRTDVLAFGNEGLHAVTHLDKGIMAVRGGPLVLDLMDHGGTRLLSDERESAEGLRLRVLPTVHPAYVLRNRRWTKVFRADVARALRWFRGLLTWKDPVVDIHPTVAAVEDFLLRQQHPYWTVDVETEYYDRSLFPVKRPLPDTMLQARMYCIGFGTPTRGICVPFLGIDGRKTFYSPEEMHALREIIARFMTDATRWKVGHNFGYFDRAIIRRVFDVDPTPVLDTILLHRAVDSELPHDLAFVGSYFTDVTSWKADKSGTEARTDEELHRYNVLDNVVPARFLPDLVTMVRLRDQERVVAVDHKIQHICQDMHTLGMRVNHDVRRAWDRRFYDGKNLDGQPLHEYTFAGGKWYAAVSETAARTLLSKDGGAEKAAGVALESVRPVKGALQHRAEFQALSGVPSINPGSYPQIRDLLFERWKLEPEDFTELGEPSTGDDSLREIMKRKGLSGQQRAALEALRWYRRYVKLRGTYTAKLKPCTEIIKDDDEFAEDVEEAVAVARDTRGKKREHTAGDRRGIVLGDGRVHPGWNAHSTVSGRLSSNTPINAQNIPILIRDIFEPSVGNVFVYCDKSQVEMRCVAALAKAARYLEVFERAWKLRGQKLDKYDVTVDPHSATAAMIFDKEWAVASTDAKARIRDYSKRFSYANFYGASPETAHDVITSTEDDRGRLIYADLDLAGTQLKIDKWLAANPEIVKWWDDSVEKVRQKGFLAESILGRRRDFLDGVDESRNEILNYLPQSATASMVNLATVALVEGPLPFGRWGPTTGLVNQCHDALVFEEPGEKAEWVRDVVTEAMTQRFDGFPVMFPAEAIIVTNWKGRKWKKATP